MTYSQNVHDRFKHALSRGVSTIMGGMKLYPTGGERLKWAIRHYSNKWGDSSEYYDDIDECVADFLALLKAKGLGPGAQ